MPSFWGIVCIVDFELLEALIFDENIYLSCQVSSRISNSHWRMQRIHRPNHHREPNTRNYLLWPHNNWVCARCVFVNRVGFWMKSSSGDMLIFCGYLIDQKIRFGFSFTFVLFFIFIPFCCVLFIPFILKRLSKFQI